jgi:DNA-binding NarL/FixJ family response regulator
VSLTILRRDESLNAELAGRRVRVLIAEDDPGVRGVLSELIEADPGLELVGVVTDAAAVIAVAAERHPDVAIVDVRMPGGGGVFAARGIKEVSSGTKVIAFSGETNPVVTTEMFAAGAVGYLVKGSSIVTILGSIRAAAGEQAV